MVDLTGCSTMQPSHSWLAWTRSCQEDNIEHQGISLKYYYPEMQDAFLNQEYCSAKKTILDMSVFKQCRLQLNSNGALIGYCSVPEQSKENAAISNEVWNKEKDILRFRKLSEWLLQFRHGGSGGGKISLFNHPSVSDFWLRLPCLALRSTFWGMR